jgi:hypothetical protein
MSYQPYTPAALTPGEYTQYPLDRRLGRPKSLSGLGGEERERNANMCSIVCVRFQVLTAASMTLAAVWVVAPRRQPSSCVVFTIL